MKNEILKKIQTTQFLVAFTDRGWGGGGDLENSYLLRSIPSQVPFPTAPPLHPRQPIILMYVRQTGTRMHLITLQIINNKLCNMHAKIAVVTF